MFITFFCIKNKTLYQKKINKLELQENYHFKVYVFAYQRKIQNNCEREKKDVIKVN